MTDPPKPLSDEAVKSAIIAYLATLTPGELGSMRQMARRLFGVCADSRDGDWPWESHEFQQVFRCFHLLGDQGYRWRDERGYQPGERKITYLSHRGWALST